MQPFLCSPNSGVFALVALYIGGFVLLLTPGILASAPLLRRKQLEPHQVLLFAFGVAALCGYLLFWIYYLNHVAGKLLTFGVVILLLMVYLDPFLRKILRAVTAAKNVRVPLVLTFAIGIFYISVAYIGYFNTEVCASNNETFILNRTIPASADYLIQRLWVDTLFENASPWNIVLDPDAARTTLGDRPPVLAGIALMFFAWIPRSLEHFYFMAISTIASLSWIAALWLVCREAKLSANRSTLLVLAVSQTFYFYFSSVFTWPKALSGALIVGAFALLVLRPAVTSSRVSGAQLVVGSIFAGLSFLTHNSTMLLLLPTALLLLTRRLFPGLRQCVIGLAIFLLISVPYSTIKTINEPTVSNLTKYTLTIPEFSPEPEENKKLSIPEALKKAYSPLSWGEIAANKFNNIAAVFEPGCFGKCDGGTMLDSNMGSELLPIIGSMKFFNLGWLLFLPVAYFSAALYDKDAVRTDSGLRSIERISRLCLGAAVLGILIYGLIIFQQRVNNIFSSGFMMLLFLAAGLRLFALRRGLVTAVFLCQFFYFQWITWLGVAGNRLIIAPAMALLYLICVLALLVSPFKLAKANSEPAAALR